MDNHNSEHVGHGTNEKSEVSPKVSYGNGEITIALKDNNNNVPELEVSHEKLMHLVVVSSDLKAYHHLHPEEKDNGVYSHQIDLPDNNYEVIVDIKPKNLNYSVEPIELQVGESPKELHDNNLVADTDFTKVINGQTVELTNQSLEVNKEVTFNFDLKGAKPDPYLGALGHVIILDGQGVRLTHVHPVSDEETVFKTEFDEPGIYKLWAEFKFGEQVNVYPFVIEVK